MFQSTTRLLTPAILTTLFITIAHSTPITHPTGPSSQTLDLNTTAPDVNIFTDYIPPRYVDIYSFSDDDCGVTNGGVALRGLIQDAFVGEPARSYCVPIEPSHHSVWIKASSAWCDTWESDADCKGKDLGGERLKSGPMCAVSKGNMWLYVECR